MLDLFYWLILSTEEELQKRGDMSAKQKVRTLRDRVPVDNRWVVSYSPDLLESCRYQRTFSRRKAAACFAAFGLQKIWVYAEADPRRRRHSVGGSPARSSEPETEPEAEFSTPIAAADVGAELARPQAERQETSGRKA